MFHLDPHTAFYNSLHWWSINNQLQLVLLHSILFTFLGSFGLGRFFWEEIPISLTLVILIYIEYVSGFHDRLLQKHGKIAYQKLIGKYPTL